MLEYQASQQLADRLTLAVWRSLIQPVSVCFGRVSKQVCLAAFVSVWRYVILPFAETFSSQGKKPTSIQRLHWRQHVTK